MKKTWCAQSRKVLTTVALNGYKCILIIFENVSTGAEGGLVKLINGVRSSLGVPG